MESSNSTLQIYNTPTLQTEYGPLVTPSKLVQRKKTEKKPGRKEEGT